jgi:putative serine protease PepD
MPAQLLQPPPGAAAPVIDPPPPAWQPLRGTPPPPPPGRVAGDGGSGGRWSWPRKLAAGFLALGLALASGAAGAYAATSLDDDTAVAAASTPVTAASGGSTTETSLASVAAAVEPSVVSITVRSAGQQVEGSGVVLRSDGLILTNNHVVEDAATGGRITVEFSDGRTATATVAATDPSTDLAVIQAEGVSGLQAATFGDSDALQVGDTVLAIGSPLGLEGSVTAGIVSALHRTFDVDADGQAGTTVNDAIQTDAPINPGNSGGPLVNSAGEVVGILTANASVSQDAGSIGVGFAIPSNQVEQVASQLTGGALTVASSSTTG